LVREDLSRDVIVSARSSPGQPWKELKLTPDTCPGLKVELERFAPQSDATVHTDRYRGELSADCQLAGGGRIELSVRFDHCRCNPFLEKRSVK
jgi:hypothetical protein